MKSVIDNYTINSKVYTKDKCLISITIVIIHEYDIDKKFNYFEDYNKYKILFEPIVKSITRDVLLLHYKDDIYDNYKKKNMYDEINKNIRKKLEKNGFIINDILITDIKEDKENKKPINNWWYF